MPLQLLRPASRRGTVVDIYNLTGLAAELSVTGQAERLRFASVGKTRAVWATHNSGSPNDKASDLVGRRIIGKAIISTDAESADRISGFERDWEAYYDLPVPVSAADLPAHHSHYMNRRAGQFAPGRVLALPEPVAAPREEPVEIDPHRDRPDLARGVFRVVAKYGSSAGTLFFVEQTIHPAAYKIVGTCVVGFVCLSLGVRIGRRFPRQQEGA